MKEKLFKLDVGWKKGAALSYAIVAYDLQLALIKTMVIIRGKEEEVTRIWLTPSGDELVQ